MFCLPTLKSDIWLKKFVGGKFNHLEERNAIVVCDNDGREFVELSNHTPIDDVSGNVKSISLDKVKESMSPMLAVNAKSMS